MLLIARLALLCFLLVGGVLAQWGTVDCGDYRVVLIRHDPRTITAVTGLSPGPGAAAGIMVDLRRKAGIDDHADAYEVTLRYLDSSGRRWTRTQILTVYVPGFALGNFLVGDATPLSVAVRPLRWESVAENTQ